MAYSNRLTFIWVKKRNTNYRRFNGWNDIKTLVSKKKARNQQLKWSCQRRN